MGKKIQVALEVALLDKDVTFVYTDRPEANDAEIILNIIEPGEVEGGHLRLIQYTVPGKPELFQSLHAGGAFDTEAPAFTPKARLIIGLSTPSFEKDRVLSAYSTEDVTVTFIVPSPEAAEYRAMTLQPEVETSLFEAIDGAIKEHDLAKAVPGSSKPILSLVQ